MGGGAGFVAGVTGIGGGIFVAPLVLTLGWLSARQTAGLSALFNLLNSAALRRQVSSRLVRKVRKKEY